MRIVIAATLLAACSPDIAPGAYYCGPEESCPEGLACDGLENLCVLPSNVTPFSCMSGDPGDDSPSAGQVIPNLECVSPIRVASGCLIGSDPADWFQFDVPASCIAVKLEARLQFPLAFQPLGLHLSIANGPAMPVETACSFNDPDDSEDLRCFEMPLEPGGHYALGVTRVGTEDCGGRCAYNRFRLDVALATP